MKDIFPNIDDNTNTALASDGLQDSPSWNMLSQEDKSRIANTNNIHRLGLKGTKCN
ncbi:MAG: hypothetical protein WBP45_13965 [Daejeonella sp.]